MSAHPNKKISKCLLTFRFAGLYNGAVKALNVAELAILALVAVCLVAAGAGKEVAMEVKLRILTPEEERVIVGKETEAPFTGEFDNHSEPGVYTCRRCGAALYHSDHKFDARCGWPAFEAEIPCAVKSKPDPDRRRTEITCANCDGHLGHIFIGEKLTPLNTRHCVNSISLDFVPEASVETNFSHAVFAGGCFWGVEYFMEKAPGVIGAVSGYTGGTVENPTYKQVCSGETGHIEAVKVVFDPRLTNFEELARLFFEIHDPTQANGQGPDIGSQYRSVVFFNSEEQRKTAEKLIALLKKNKFDVVTSIEEEKTFWQAEDRHQDYYENKRGLPYCHSRVKRFK